MGDQADYLRDQEEYASMLLSLHKQDRCNEITDDCPFCYMEYMTDEHRTRNQEEGRDYEAD